MAFSTFHLITVVVALVGLVDTATGSSAFDPYLVIEAEDYTTGGGAGAITCPSSAMTYLGSINAGDIVTYTGVDFGSGGQLVQFRVAAWDSGYINLRLDSSVSRPIVTIPIQKTGAVKELCDFYIFEQFLATVPTGVHDLVLTFDFPTGAADFVNIDWFAFKSTS